MTISFFKVFVGFKFLIESFLYLKFQNLVLGIFISVKSINKNGLKSKLEYFRVQNTVRFNCFCWVVSMVKWIYNQKFMIKSTSIQELWVGILFKSLIIALIFLSCLVILNKILQVFDMVFVIQPFLKKLYHWLSTADWFSRKHLVYYVLVCNSFKSLLIKQLRNVDCIILWADCVSIKSKEFH